MKSHVITLRETSDRTQAAIAHLNERAHPFELFFGVNAEKWGLTTTHPYDADGGSVIVPRKHVGLHLSHWILWQIFIRSKESYFSVMEDDVQLASDWKPRVESVEASLPADWDICLLGHCNAINKPMEHVRASVWRVSYPQCTHWYLVNRKALPFLIESQEKAWAPIDLSLIFRSYPNLNVYTAVPRLASQFGMDLSE